MKETTINCVASTRVNICETVKENSSMLLELRNMLNRLSDTLECIPVAPNDGPVREEPKCLLDEVLFQKAILEDMQCVVNRIYASLHG